MLRRTEALPKRIPVSPVNDRRSQADRRVLIKIKVKKNNKLPNSADAAAHDCQFTILIHAALFVGQQKLKLETLPRPA